MTPRPFERRFRQLCRRRRRRATRRAFTLLEVLLALAILVGSLAVIGELGRRGMSNSRRAAALAVAQIHCESKLAEITSGIVTPSVANGVPLETDPEWLYSVMIDSTNDMGLISVRVTVSENLPPESNPAEFTLVRWMPESAQTGEESTGTESTGTGDSASTASASTGSGS